MQQRTKMIMVWGAAVAIVAGFGSAAVAAGYVADPPAEQRSESTYTDAHRADAAVTQVGAERIARDARPGTVVDSHLQTEGDGLRWEVKTDDGTNVWEIQIDPTTGAVVSNHPDE